MTTQEELLNLTLPSKFSTSDATSLRERLCQHLNVGAPRYVLRKSVDPGTGDQFIQLIGDALRWLPLSAPAAVFLSTLAKRAAESIWDAAAAALKRPDLKPLADVAESLANAAKIAGSEVDLIIGLDIPERNYGTAFIIQGHDPLRIAHSLAVFAVHADQISAKMKAEVQAGRAPLGRALISIDEDGLLIRWRSQKDFADHKIRIPARPN